MKRKYQQYHHQSHQQPVSLVSTTTVKPDVQEKEVTLPDCQEQQQPNCNPQSSRPNKKPSLNYPPIHRPRKVGSLAELLEEFNLNRFRFNVGYNAVEINFRSFIEGEKDIIKMSQKFKSIFKPHKDIRSMSCRLSEQSTETLTLLRNTVQRYSEFRQHEAEVETICEQHKKDEGGFFTSGSGFSVIDGLKDFRAKKLKDDEGASEPELTTSATAPPRNTTNDEDSDDDDDSDHFDLAV